MNHVTQQALAQAFARRVREELHMHLAEINRRNAELARSENPLYRGCCATHDFCDANMLMLEAWSSVTGKPESEWDADSESEMELVNGAWDMAKAAGFAEEKL